MALCKIKLKRLIAAVRKSTEFPFCVIFELVLHQFLKRNLSVNCDLSVGRKAVIPLLLYIQADLVKAVRVNIKFPCDALIALSPAVTAHYVELAVYVGLGDNERITVIFTAKCRIILLRGRKLGLEIDRCGLCFRVTLRSIPGFDLCIA